MKSYKIIPHKSGYTTYCPPMNVRVPEGVDVYYVRECEPEPGRVPYKITRKIDGTPITTIKRGEGVILHTKLSEIVFEVIEDAEPIPGNLLVGALEPIPYDEGRKEAYIFTGKEVEGIYRIGFFPWRGGILSAEACYLQL